MTKKGKKMSRIQESDPSWSWSVYVNLGITLER